MMRINNNFSIIFDFDGTLVDSNSIKHDSFFEVTKDIKNSKQNLNYIIKNNPEYDRYMIFKALGKKLNFSISQIDNLIKKYNILSHKRIATADEIQGSAELLDSLNKNNVDIYINSATPQDELISSIKSRGLPISTQNIYGRPASKVENINSIREQNKIINEILIVGDGLLDRDSARELNLSFVCIKNKYNMEWASDEKLAFNNNKELKKYLEFKRVL